MKKIIVYCEVNPKERILEDVSYELITKAQELARRAQKLQQGADYMVEAVALGSWLEAEAIDKAFASGAERFVLIKDNALDEFCQTVHANCFCQYVSVNPVDIIIFPATHQGRIIAPRVTTALDTGLVADCTDLDFVVKDNQIKFAPTRPTFGSELMATILSKKSPQCATVRPKIFKADFSLNMQADYAEFRPEIVKENRIRLIDSFADNSVSSDDLINSKVVLVAGYGLLDNKHGMYFTKLEQLARLMGATVGATKKVVDLGFMKKETQIGQTGTTIEPEVYISFGVSGAIQHIMGMKNAKTIIAINTDENADIFNYADYKIVADAKEIIDEMLSKLNFQ